MDTSELSGTIAINGTDLAYQDRGSGPPIVFVHGALSDLRTWSAQVQALAPDHRVITFSRRYHWPNKPIIDGADDPMSPHVADLAELIRRLGVAPAHLVANSWGALVCLHLAATQPELVQSMVLEEPPVMPLLVSNQPRPAELLRLLTARPGAAIAVLRFGARGVGPSTTAFRKGDNEAGMLTFARAVLGKSAFDALPEARRAQMRDNLAPQRAQFLGAGFEPFTPADAQQITTPTLLLSGEFSPAIFHHLTHTLHQLLPNVRHRTIPTASHLMHEQQAEHCTTTIAEFIAEHPPTPARHP
jgi:pimeloyl-ACP methyl ester carboxylesterase